MITINGVEMPIPQSYKLTISDLDSENTSRSETGSLFRERIKTLHKASVKWRVNTADMQKLASAMSSEMFMVNFFDGTTNGTTAEMYAGDRDIELITKNKEVFWDYSCSLIEY